MKNTIQTPCDSCPAQVSAVIAGNGHASCAECIKLEERFYELGAKWCDQDDVMEQCSRDRAELEKNYELAGKAPHVHQSAAFKALVEKGKAAFENKKVIDAEREKLKAKRDKRQAARKALTTRATEPVATYAQESAR